MSLMDSRIANKFLGENVWYSACVCVCVVGRTVGGAGIPANQILLKLFKQPYTKQNHKAHSHCMHKIGSVDKAIISQLQINN